MPIIHVTICYKIDCQALCQCYLNNFVFPVFQTSISELEGSQTSSKADYEGQLSVIQQTVSELTKAKEDLENEV